MNEHNYRLSVDWMNLRVDCSPFDFVALLNDDLGFSPDLWKIRKGINWYDKALFYEPAGSGSIIVAWNEDSDGNYLDSFSSSRPYGTHISISGDGCRYLGSYGKDVFAKFLHCIVQFPCHCSRIDIALDLFDCQNGIVDLIHNYANSYGTGNDQYYFNCNLTKSSDFLTVHRNYSTDYKYWYDNVTIGSRNSTRGQLQLYNKLEEVKHGRLSSIEAVLVESIPDPNYWWRLECRCKSFADVVFQNLVSAGIYHAALTSFFEFGKFVNADYDITSISKCSVVDVWNDLYVYFFTMSEKELEQTINFVQFVSLPFVYSDIVRNNLYSDRIASFLYKQINLIFADDIRRREFLRSAEFKHNKSYSSFGEEFRSVYGRDPFSSDELEMFFSRGKLPLAL